MNEFLNNACAIHQCKPLSQTLLMAIYRNQPFVILHGMLLEMWTTWQNDYAVHVTDAQKAFWETFFHSYVPLADSVMDQTLHHCHSEIGGSTLKAVLSSLHWDANIVSSEILSGRPMEPDRLLETSWTLRLAKLVVERVCYSDTIRFFIPTGHHSLNADNLRRLQRKMALFPQTKPMKNIDHVDWFFLRTLLCRNRSAGPVIWAGGSVQLLHDNDYSREDVHDAFQREHIDINLFYSVHEDITEWLMDLQEYHLCNVTVTENRHYVYVQCLTDRSVHFKINLIHRPASSRHTTVIQYAMAVLVEFDMPPCQQAIVWDATSKTFIHLSTLACSMIDKDNTLIHYNHGMEPKMMGRMEKYTKRGFMLVRTDANTVYGIFSKSVDYENGEIPASLFVNIRALYGLDCLLTLFKEEDERTAKK